MLLAVRRKPSVSRAKPQTPCRTNPKPAASALRPSKSDATFKLRIDQPLILELPIEKMNCWKNLLIDAYRISTSPWRSYWLNRARKNENVPLAILFYHRVANEHPNPWTISEQDFARQIDWMQSNFDLISLEESQRRMRVGNLRPAISITFDDGYSDNCSFAIPWLIEQKIPFTYFVTTAHISENRPFDHDVDRGQPLLPNSPESLRAMAAAGVEIGGHTRDHVDLGSISDEAELYDQVIAATEELADMIDRPIRYFAFPFGQINNLNKRVFQLLADHGIQGVCSAYGGLNSVGSDPFHLQRIHGDPNFSRMKNWLTFDPRLKSVPGIQWRSEEVSPGLYQEVPATALSDGNQSPIES